ncbi:MAG: S8 family serine peptidase [Proteobacteria bacterium]|nr:S8 family serine peptidase [Pseudomonadota bacterium]
MRNRLIVIAGLIMAAWGGLEIFKLIDFTPPEEQTKKTIKDESDGAVSATVTEGPGTGRNNQVRRPETDIARRQLSSRSEQSLVDPNSARETAETLQTESVSSGASNSSSNAAQALDYVPREIIVLDPPAELGPFAKRMGIEILETTPLEGLDISYLRLRTPVFMSPQSAISQLNRQFRGLVIDLNHVYTASQDQSRGNRSSTGNSNRQSTPTRSLSRARSMIGWDGLPQSCGAGVRIGMIDGAVDTSHPALRGKDILVRNVQPQRQKPGSAAHGKAVAALLIGSPGPEGWGGLLPSASLRAANVFGINSRGKTVGSTASILRGISWLATQKVHVVNIGLTGPDNKNVRKAMSIAHKRDLVVVAAAGNRGFKGKRAYPAGYYHVLAVTAVGPYKGAMTNANRGEYIDFAAPGVRLWTAVPGGGKYQSGSSFATTYVTAMIGLEVARGAEPDADAIRERLSKQVIDIGEPGKDDLFGYGMIGGTPRC